MLDGRDYLEPSQLGFRPGYGTERTLVTLLDDLVRVGWGSAFIFSLPDFSAFSAIDHGILLEWFRGLGLGGAVLHWFGSFLHNWE